MQRHHKYLQPPEVGEGLDRWQDEQEYCPGQPFTELCCGCGISCRQQAVGLNNNSSGDTKTGGGGVLLSSELFTVCNFFFPVSSKAAPAIPGRISLPLSILCDEG